MRSLESKQIMSIFDISLDSERSPSKIRKALRKLLPANIFPNLDLKNIQDRYYVHCRHGEIIIQADETNRYQPKRLDLPSGAKVKKRNDYQTEILYEGYKFTFRNFEVK